jgi:hypothetical protein
MFSTTSGNESIFQQPKFRGYIEMLWKVTNRKTDLTVSDTLSWGMIAQYILAYLIWFLFCALSFRAIWLIRTNLVEDIFFMRVNAWQLLAIGNWSVWLMGIVWIVGIFIAEGYLRKSVENGRLLPNVGKLFSVPLVIVALSYLIHAL